MIAQASTALFIGRFQPLHLGHISVLDWLRKQGIDNIIIGIGSSQYQGTADNPFPYVLREQFWKKACSTYQLTIVALPDIHDDNRWIEYIMELVYTATSLRPQFIVSNNPWVERLATTANIPLLTPPQTIQVSGTAIRQLIRNHDDSWKKYVPDGIHQLIERENSALKTGA